MSFARSEALPRKVFDDLLASLVRGFGVSTAELNLVSGGLVWPKAIVSTLRGPVPGESQEPDIGPKLVSLCARVATENAPLVVYDVQQDWRFDPNEWPAVRASFRFYAGVPLIASNNTVLGTLCVLDAEPREPTDEQINMLIQAARYAVALIEQTKAVAELQQERSVLSATGDVLAMIVGGAELPKVLDTLAYAVQAAMPDTICSILLLDDIFLRHGSAPDLPPEYWTSINNLPVGPSTGSCGTAAFTGKDVIVSDIQTDARWANYRHLAAPFDLRACWSVPIKQPSGRVLGTFALYYREVRVPTDDDLRQMGRWANLGEVAITRARDMDALRVAAVIDPLTGLVNRTEVVRRIETAIAIGQSSLLAVLFIDLDQFKFVNDTLGHAVGDELLGIVAKRLGASVGPLDTVARFGGDEFIVFCPDIYDVEEAESLGRDILATVQRPMLTSGRSISLSASIGVALRVADSSSASGDVIGDADIAMYAAKRAGRSSVAVFTPDMREKILERLNLEADLSVALANDEIDCVFQPILKLDTGQVTAVETLMRWESVTYGAVPPDVFIPVAEESGLIGDLGEYVLSRACQQLAAWRQVSPLWENTTMWVNVTVRQLEDTRFLDRVQDVLAANGLLPGNLGLEVTESLFVSETSKARNVLTTLRNLGVHVAIDDFGTGYSSLAQLKHLPVDVLKIDRQFVADMGSPGSDARIVEAILVLARSLGLKAVAEGVETTEQRDLLVSMGCVLGQGYLWSKAVSANELAELVEKSNTPGRAS